jgi:hypothetical protein
MDLRGFFELLYGDKPDKSYLLIWTPGKTRGGNSFWTPNINDAVDSVLKDPKKDQYFQVGLSGKAYRKNHRCTLDDKRPVIALPATFADIDFGTEGHHKSKQNPPTQDDAYRLIHGHGFDPTVVVHSGHGLQAYWVFKELWELDTPEERQKAMAFLRRFKAFLQNVAAKKGWSIDSVQDLVRILRPPGSYNCKSEPSRLVQIIEHNEDLRYNPENLEEFLPEDPGHQSYDSGKIKTAGGTLIIKEKRQPPPSKFAQLWAIFPKFQATWENQRTGDLTDTSPSGYDMALALFAAQANWKPQEIVDLLIAHREHHGHDLKIKNIQYYARTVINARDQAISESFETHQDMANLQLSEELNPTVEDSPEEKLRKDVSIRMGVKILKIEKYLCEDPDYIIHIEYNGKIEEITLKINHFTSQSQFRNKIAAATGKVITRFQPREWDNHIQQLLNLAEQNIKEVGEEASDKGAVRYWLEDYLEGSHKSDLESAAMSKKPFRHEDHWYFFLENFHVWAKMKRGSDISRKQLGVLARRLGCINVKFNILLDNNERTSRSTYRVPNTIGVQKVSEKIPN